ncbi:MAG: hypothetical protein M1308_08925, partial [Actinobacteria bacterium]|nr:hypothetical protein [Actinomycetota bacterium]
MVRRYLLIICFVNIILYYSAFAYFDNILDALSRFNLPVGFLNFLQYFIILALGFMIGFLIVLSMRIKSSRNYFDIKVMLLSGLIPILALLLYKTGFVNFIVTRFFNSNITISEAVFYFFSMTKIWTLWLGITIGASVRIKLPEKKKFR